jgi:hypothetical protein
MPVYFGRILTGTIVIVATASFAVCQNAGERLAVDQDALIQALDKAAPEKFWTNDQVNRTKRSLKITESEWAAFCKDFDDTMAKFNVPEAERNELFAIVESTKGDIVCG